MLSGELPGWVAFGVVIGLPPQLSSRDVEVHDITNAADEIPMLDVDRELNIPHNFVIHGHTNKDPF